MLRAPIEVLRRTRSGFLERLPQSSRRRWSPQPSIWMGIALCLPLLVVMGTLVIFPLAKLVIDSMVEGDRFGNYTAFFQSGAAVRALRTTLLSSFAVTFFALLLGSVLAWNLRTQRSMLVRSLLWAVTLMPFWMGVVVKNYALTLLLQRRGVINEFLQLFPFIDEPFSLLYTQGAVVLGILYSLLPFAVLSLYVTFSTIDTDLLLASEGLGAPRYRAMTSILLPLAIPGLLATGAIIFVLSIGFYVTPILLGGAQSPFVASLINTQIFVLFDYPAAAASGTILLITAFIVLGLVGFLVGRERLRRAIA